MVFQCNVENIVRLTVKDVFEPWWQQTEDVVRTTKVIIHKISSRIIEQNRTL